MLCLIASATGCATGAVRRVDQSDWIRKLNRSALTSNEVSDHTMRYLRRNELVESYEEDRAELIRTLADRVCPQPDRDTLFALSELCYLEAKEARQGSKEADVLYRSCICYAYACLFDEEAGEPISEFDPRFRMVSDFYNRSLAGAIAGRPDNWKALIREGLPSPLIRGKARTTLSRESRGELEDLDSGSIAYNYEVESFPTHYRRSGLGLPIIGRRESKNYGTSERFRTARLFLSPTYGATLLVEPQGPLCQAHQGEPVYDLTFKIYDPIETPSVNIRGRTVPLEADLSIPLALLLEEQSLLAGGGARSMYAKLQGEYIGSRRGLYFLQPYQPGKIPVVFVHGLMSSPMTWLNMFNDLMSDPALMEHFQFWTFFYPTGNPIVFSAAELRATLQTARQELDPEGSDVAMDQMVIVGHSMGGLLTRMMISSSDGEAVIRDRFDVSLDQLDITDEQRDQIDFIVKFDPLPFVSRVLFLSTPHRGAEMARGIIGRIGDKVSRLPKYIYEQTEEALEALKLTKTDIPSGIDDLQIGGEFVNVLEKLPMDPRVPYHSIIGNKDSADIAGGTDGVVAYESSHLDGAQSEMIIQSTHSLQGHPKAIHEVRRVLLQHVRELDSK